MNLINIPKLPYIVFELVKIKKGLVGSGMGDFVRGEERFSPYEFVETLEERDTFTTTDVILLDVNPSDIVYDLNPRKTVHAGPGDDNFTVEKGGLQPTKITIGGTFGSKRISRGIRSQDGFGRMKEFRKMFAKSHSVSLEDEKRDEVYGVNYYDFLNHFWGYVDLDNLRISANARLHSKIHQYTMQFTCYGKLLQSTSKDPLLRNLKFLLEANEFIEGLNEDINTFIDESFLSELDDILISAGMFREVVGNANLISQTIGAVLNPIVGSSGIALNTGILSDLRNIVTFKDLI